MSGRILHLPALVAHGLFIKMGFKRVLTMAPLYPSILLQVSFQLASTPLAVNLSVVRKTIFAAGKILSAVKIVSDKNTVLPSAVFIIAPDIRLDEGTSTT